MNRFNINDRVRFSPVFLRAVHADRAGDPAPCSWGPFAVGKVLGVHDPICDGGPYVVIVLWADGRQGACLATNLEGVK